MKSAAIIILASLASFAAKASAVTPGALAVLGFERGPSPRLALVALEPIIAGEQIELIGGSEDSRSDKVVAGVRFTQCLAIGDVIQIAGSFCSAGTVIYSAPQNQLASCQIVKLTSNGWEVCRTTPWMMGLGAQAAYVGTRNHESICLAWASLLSRDNWRAGPIPAQDPFIVAPKQEEAPR